MKARVSRTVPLAGLVAWLALTTAGVPARAEEGKNWLALIAVNDYLHFPPLRAPINDVRDLRTVLVERYAFEEETTLELLNEEATLNGIYKLFRKLNENVRSQDSLVLYYAGHGKLDPLTNTGYWIPYDGGLDFSQNWLGDVAVLGFLRNVRAKHVLVIADSCFSGNLLALSRGGEEREAVATDRYQRESLYRSRKVLTSGSFEPVADSGLGDHSAFAFHLIRTLEENQNPYIDVDEIYNRIRSGVTGQLPLIGALQGAGHQTGGSYVFRRKGAEALDTFLFEPEDDVPSRGAAAADGRIPRDPRVSEDEAQAEILDLLARWKSSYERLDFEGLREVWPTCPWKKQKGVEGYEITIPPESIEIRRTGIRARVTCRVRIKGFGRATGETELTAEFRLEKQTPGGWRILEYNPRRD